MSGLLRGLFERREIAPSRARLAKLMGGVRTSAGVQVREETALRYVAVLACVRILAESVASLPLILYRRERDGGRERMTEHPLYGILHDAPNSEMSAYEMRETLTAHVALWGNAYAQIVWDGAGRVRELWPLLPSRMRVERGTDGRLRYRYTPSTGGERTLSVEEVFHLRGLGGNGIIGYSPIALARQAVGLGLAAEEFGARFFGEGARPPFVLTYPGVLDDEAYERLRQDWKSRYGGLENSHEVAILEEGLDVKVIGIPPDDAQFLQTRRFQTEEIARLYRIPPHMLADLERATYSNVEQMSLDFVIHTLRPWLVRWEQAIARSLLTAQERAAGLYAEHLVEGMLRGDTTARAQLYAIGRQWGWYSANDIRRLENLPPIAGGDEYLVPLNMIPAGSSGATRAADEATLRAIRALPRVQTPTRGYAEARHRLMVAHLPLYRDVAARMLRRERQDVGAIVRKTKSEAVMWEAIEGFYRDHQDYVKRTFRPLAYEYGDLIAQEARAERGEPRTLPMGERREETALSPEVEGFIEAYLRDFAERHGAMQVAELRRVAERAAASGEDVEAALLGAMETWPETGAERVARREANRFGNAVAYTVLTLLGARAMRWVNFDPSCPYCRELDGRIVGVGEFFLQGGLPFHPEGADRPLTPGRSIKHPPAHDGCDCGLEAA